MRDALYKPLWWLAGLTIDVLSAGGRALHRAADWLAGRTGARMTIDDHVQLLLFEFRRDGGAR